MGKAVIADNMNKKTETKNNFLDELQEIKDEKDSMCHIKL